MKGLPTIKKPCQFRFCPENDSNIRYCFSISKKSKLKVNTTLISVTVKAKKWCEKCKNDEYKNIFCQNLTDQVFSVA